MRLFLGIFPPPAVRARLGSLADAAQARCGGRRMPEASLHLTLAFLGEVQRTRAEALVDWVQGLSVSAGEWRLDSWGHFRRPGIVWVGGRASDPALARLQASLWNDLEGLGLSGRPSRFVSHVTLLRRAARPGAARPGAAGLPPVDLAWHYRRLALVRSFTENDGARYEALAHSA